MKNQFKLVIILIIVVIISLFAVINNANIPINFIFTKIELPLSIILALAILIGGLLSYLLSLTSMIQKSKEITTLKTKVKNAEKDYQTAIEEIARLEGQITNQNNEASNHSEQNENSQSME